MEIYFFPRVSYGLCQVLVFTYNIIIYATGIGDILCAFLAGLVIQKVITEVRGEIPFMARYHAAIDRRFVPFSVFKDRQRNHCGGDHYFGFLASHLFWNVGYAAVGGLMGSITQDPDERTILSSSRAQGQSAGNLLFSYTGGLMVPIFTVSIGLVYGFSVTIAIFGVLMIAGYFYLYKMTAGCALSKVKPVLQKQRPSEKKSVGKMVGLVLKNPPLLFLIFAEIFRNTCLFFVLSFAVYYFKNVLGNQAFLKVFILANGIGTLLGAFAATWIGVKIGKRHAYGLACILGGLVYLSVAFIERWTPGVLRSSFPLAP